MTWSNWKKRPVKCRPLIVSGIIFCSYAVAQEPIRVGPDVIRMTATAGERSGALASIGISSRQGTSVPFRFERFSPVSRPVPEFIVMRPTSGTTPAEVLIGLNENVVQRMPPGMHLIQVWFASTDSPPSRSFATVVLTLTPPGRSVIRSIMSSASHLSAIAPGDSITISGERLGPEVGGPTAYNEGGTYPEAVDGTSVSIGGLPAPLLEVQSNRIRAVVPYGLAGKPKAEVVVSRYGNSSLPFVIDLADTAPALLAQTGTGSHEGSILLYLGPGEYRPVTSGDPAPRGGVIVMYFTGAGAWDPPPPDGTINLRGNLTAPQFTAKPVSLMIGGRPAAIYFVGVPAYNLWGKLQLTAFVPADSDSGDQPVVLKIGDNDNASQGVTISVK